MPLFRPEAARGQDTLHGDVNLAPPVSWQVLGLFLLAGVMVAAIFMALAQYAKVTVVSGTVTGDKGVIRIAPSRAGTYDRVLVEEGQVVKAGDPLARVILSTGDLNGTLQAQRAQAIAEQRAALADRLSGITAGGQERVASLEAQISGAQVQIGRLRDQMDQERTLIRSAEDELESVQTLAQQGYLTGSNLRQRQEQVASRRQTLSRLGQELSERETALGVARTDMARARAETRSGLGELSGARADLNRSAAGDDLQSGVVLTAPVDGVVTSVVVHPGDAATLGAAAISLLPRGSKVEATLAVPTAGAGLLERGQPVRIAVDAFPYQTYGSLSGAITSVSQTTVPLAGKAEGGEAFMVRVSLPPSITAYGAARPLRPGMTLTARIRTRPRSLLAWLFDPVLAVRNR